MILNSISTQSDDEMIKKLQSKLYPTTFCPLLESSMRTDYQIVNADMLRLYTPRKEQR